MAKTKIKCDPTTGRYYVRMQVGGTRRRFWFSTDKEKAQRDLKKLAKDIATGTVVITPTTTTLAAAPDGSRDMRLEELAHAHLEWLENNRSAATYKLRQRAVKLFLEFMGPCMVSAVTKLKLSEFHDGARKHHGRGPNRGNWLLQEVRAMFRWAEDWDVCPMPVRKFPPMTHTPPPTKRFVDEEVLALMECLPSGDFKDMIFFGLITGLRPQEIRGLRREHIIADETQRLHIRLEEHKTAKVQRDARPRSAPLSVEAEEIVRRQLSAHISPYVFLNDDGTPYSADVFRRKLERLCGRAKVPKRAPYALRHTFASVEAENGVDALTLAQLMGHTDISTTARYVSATQEHHRALSQKAATHFSKLMQGGEKDAAGPQKVASEWPVRVPA